MNHASVCVCERELAGETPWWELSPRPARPEAASASEPGASPESLDRGPLGGVAGKLSAVQCRAQPEGEAPPHWQSGTGTGRALAPSVGLERSAASLTNVLSFSSHPPPRLCQYLERDSRPPAEAQSLHWQSARGHSFSPASASQPSLPEPPGPPPPGEFSAPVRSVGTPTLTLRHATAAWRPTDDSCWPWGGGGKGCDQHSSGSAAHDWVFPGWQHNHWKDRKRPKV